MGVPAFFKWLTIRYPSVVIDALSAADLAHYHAEYAKQQTKGESGDNDGNIRGEIDPDILIRRKIEENNPKVDNLYLDMNGIIHPCCHPLDKPQPKNETEMFNLIFEYMDTVIDIVKPAKTLYLAIDGVAPRAKMNQQRSRRFRTALDAQEKAERTATIRTKWAAEGIEIADKPSSQETGFDSNVITPGTEFMRNLSKALQLCIIERLHNSDRWSHLKVIFSDASVPGEGEHKILDFIRSQRAQKDYDPNTSHCIHGADADLIMLGLSTHEAHFYILREAVIQEKDKKCRKCHKNGHLTHECGSEAAKDEVAIKLAQAVQFQFVKLPVVREYLYLEFKDIKLPFEFEFERIIDDFVFLCFLVGNDFLPHLPSLSIREGALDALIFMYKNLLPRLGGYFTRGSGELDFSKIDILFCDLARCEEEFFKQHQRNAIRNEERRRREEEKEKTYNDIKKQQEREDAREGQSSNQEPVKWRNEDKRAAPITSEPKKDEQEVADAKPDLASKELTDYEKGQMTAAQFEEYGKSYVFANIMCKPGLSEDEKMALAREKLESIVSKQMKEVNEQKVEGYQDKVRFGTEGWKSRYYAEKFEVAGEEETKKFCKDIQRSYIEGLAWVFSYYYNGCPSWHWYYPYHYAPFASDLIGCDSLDIKFELGGPVAPFEQLLSVFPKQSNHAIPACYRKLYEPGSDVLDFYPAQVKLDINGARYAWMGVNLLPFIDRARLKKAMDQADEGGSKLSPQERERNKVYGDVRLFFLESARNQGSTLQTELLKQKDEQQQWNPFTASFAQNDGIAGEVGPLTVAPGSKKRDYQYGQSLEIKCGALEFTTQRCLSFQVRFLLPPIDKHSPKLLKGVVLQPRQVEDFAIYHTNRRPFGGEEAIRIVENVLKIDASQDPVYQFGGRQNRSGQEYGGYRNNRAIYSGSDVPQLGQRRNYQEYSRDNQGYGNGGHDQSMQKRQRMNYGYDGSGVQSHGSGPTQEINFNLRGGHGGSRNQHTQGPSVISQNYQRQMDQAAHAEGGSTQLASLLNKFNDVHSRGQNSSNVLMHANLEQTQQLRNYDYQQHLRQQQYDNHQQRSQFPGYGRQDNFNSHHNQQSHHGGYNRPHRGGYQGGHRGGGYRGGHEGGHHHHNDQRNYQGRY